MGWLGLIYDVADLTQHESHGYAKQCKVVSADVQLLCVEAEPYLIIQVHWA